MQTPGIATGMLYLQRVDYTCKDQAVARLSLSMIFFQAMTLYTVLAIAYLENQLSQNRGILVNKSSQNSIRKTFGVDKNKKQILNTSTFARQ